MARQGLLLMLACLVKIMPMHRATGERLPVRVSSVNDAVKGPKVNGIGGAIWEPALVSAPVLSFTVWNGDFQAAVSVGNASLTINTNALKQTYSFADECHWIGSPVEIYAETPGTSWPWRLRFKGKISGFGRKGDTLTLGCQVDQEPFEADVLTKTYAGTGGAEGTADLKNRVKPLVLGWAENVEPVLIDPINSVFQFSAYGPIEAVDALFERGASFGASVGDYADYDALVAATIPAGRWGTCLAEGMIRLGAPAFGVITGDVAGHKVGATTPELTGAVIAALADIAGIDAEKLNSDALAALDIDKPYPVNVVLMQQAKFIDVAREMVLFCNYQAGVYFDGRFTAIKISFDQSEALTMDSRGRSWPQVREAEELDVSPPFWKTIVGANRCWRVHTPDEIAFAANLIERGRYDAAESYREGNIVDLADGSRWLYVNPVASTGNAPPTWPTSSNAYWENLNPPTYAKDIAYNDGQSVEDLKPAEAGATEGAPTGTPVGSITADDVASTINSGGGVADDQVSTSSVVDEAVTSVQQASNGSVVTGSGSTSWQTVITFNVVMASPGDIIAWATMKQAFSSGEKEWNARLKVDGTVVFTTGGTKFADSVALSGKGSLEAAGTYAVTLEWAGEDSTISIPSGGASLISMRRYK